MQNYEYQSIGIREWERKGKREKKKEKVDGKL